MADVKLSLSDLDPDELLVALSGLNSGELLVALSGFEPKSDEAAQIVLDALETLRETVPGGIQFRFGQPRGRRER